MVCGDFNVKRFAAERANGYRISGAMVEFSECINDLKLVDPLLFGGSFTWRRGNNHNNASRIDRFLYSSDWENVALQVKLSLLPKLGSDHNPILLTCGD